MFLNCGVGEDSWESLGCKKIQPVHPKGNHSWVFIGRNDAKAETPVLWPPHSKSWLIGKDSDAGRDWGQEEKGMTEDEMARWHHGLYGRESEWTLGVGDGQGSLVCCDSWGCKESDTTERLIWSDLIWWVYVLYQPIPYKIINTYVPTWHHFSVTDNIFPYCLRSFFILVRNQMWQVQLTPHLHSFPLHSDLSFERVRVCIYSSHALFILFVYMYV